MTASLIPNPGEGPVLGNLGDSLWAMTTIKLKERFPNGMAV